MFEPRLRIAASLLMSMVITGCVIMGDAVVSVVGTISQPENAESLRDCEIRGTYAESGRVFSSRQVSGRFEEGFAVPAGKREYRFEIECADGWYYQSEVFTLGGRRDPFGRVIDLGEVNLQAAN